MRQSSRVVLFTAVVALVAVASPHAQRAWVEVRSPNFVVASDADERTGRDVAWQFEQVRSALKTVWPWARLDMDRPILVLGVRNEEGMRQLAPKYFEERGGVRPATVFTSAPDRHYVALRTDITQDDRIARANPYAMAYWSYASLVIGASLGHNLPLWLSRGLATVMSNTIVADDGIQVGRLPPDALQRIQGAGRLRLAELLSVTTQSPWYTDSDRLLFFDAQAAVFTHYLMFGDNGAHREGLNQFVTLVTSGRTPAEAIAGAFPDLAQVEGGFGPYLQKPVYTYTRLGADMAVRRDTFTARPLSPVDVATRKAAFHAAMRRPVEARALIAEARQSSPEIAAAYEVEGLLLDVDNKTNDARDAFGHATEAGSTNFYALYRWAALTWYQQNVDAETRARVQAVAEKSVRNNPRFPPSLVLLGQVRARLGAPDEGATFVRRAVALEPDRVAYRVILAQMLWSAGKRDEAKTEAQQALAAATTDPDRKTAQDVVDFIARASASAPAAGPTASASPSGATTSAAAAPNAAARPDAAPAGQRIDLSETCRTGTAAECQEVIATLANMCEGGTGSACSMLGQGYANGEGVAADPARAVALYQQACAKQSRAGCLNLAVMMAQGRGTPRDLPKAIATTEPWCQQGDLYGCTLLGTLLLNETSPGQRARGRDLLSTACKDGSTQACDTLKKLPN